MTRQEHIDLSERYRQIAIQALTSFRETMDRKYWEDYKANKKLANRHLGIANAMFTRKYGKI